MTSDTPHVSHVTAHCVAAVSGCEPSLLPALPHGAVTRVRRFRGGLYRFSCSGGRTLVGDDMAYCDRGVWSVSSPPMCISEWRHCLSSLLITFLETGCGEPVITSPDHLVMETILPGGLYTFHCTEMTSLLGSPALECGARGYNASVPVCSRGPALVTMSGPGLVTRGQRPGYRCDTSPGLEEVNILWRIEGAEELASDAGWERDGVLVRSWAEMTLEVTEALDSITVECFIQSDQYSVADNMVVQIQCEY